MELFGKEIKDKELRKYLGDMSQIADAREAVLSAGKADGVRVIDVKTGSGLAFSVLPSRGMDIAWADYKGAPLAYIGKPGVVSPAYYEAEGSGFLRNFYAGLLTTCGLSNIGPAVEDEGEMLTMHGRIGNIPAHDVSVQKEWEGDEYVIRIRGKVSESKVFSENLVLTREITTKLASKSFRIHDTVENCAFKAHPLMILYHYNFGFPIVSEDTVLMLPEGTKTVGRDGNEELAKAKEFQPPTQGYAEQVFLHDTPKGSSYACLYNKALDLGAYVKFNRDELKLLCEWKMMGEGEYVVGLEPSNYPPIGRKNMREENKLDMLEPGEIRHYEFEVGVVESQEEAENILK